MSVRRQGLRVPTHLSVYMEKENQKNYKTVYPIYMLVGARSEICEGFISCVIISP